MMAATITDISPAKGSPFGGQVVTITGAGFGVSGSVTIEGRTATVGTWSDTTATVTAPPRMDTDGMVFGGGPVAVVLTAEDLSTDSTTYEYSATQIEKAVMSMASRLGQCSIQAGYAHDIGPAQVRAMKEDQSVPTGAAWPQVIAYVEDFDTITDEPYDFVKDTATVVVQAVKPCADPQSWRQEAFLMLSDIRRAVMRERSNGGTCNTTTTTGGGIGKSSDTSAGALSGAQMTFQIEVPSIINDMTTSTVFDSNLP